MAPTACKNSTNRTARESPRIAGQMLSVGAACATGGCCSTIPPSGPSATEVVSAVNVRHLPWKYEVLPGAAEGGADDGHRPISSEEAAEQRQTDVTPRPEPADTPEDVQEKRRQPNHERHRQELLDDEGRKVPGQ